MEKIEEIESALSNLYGIVFNLRIQNEVNKVMINALKQSLLHENIQTIDDCIDSVEFMSGIQEKQIKEQWSQNESDFFKELIHQEIKILELLKNKNS
jgi:hypothetical protein